MHELKEMDGIALAMKFNLQDKMIGGHNMKKFRALVACEESQAVTIELRKRGWEAYSCDIQECSGGHPEWHIQEDVIPLVNGDCMFKTTDGKMHSIQGKWDLLIAHPPCTYLTVTGNRWFNVERYGEKAIQRMKDREEAVEFFMVFANKKVDSNVKTDKA